MDLSKFKAIFISEVEDKLQILNSSMLFLEKAEEDKQKNKAEIKNKYNEIMRASHTIKGSSASMGFVKMAFLTHILEDVFDGARNDKIVLNPGIYNQIFQAIDNIEKSLNSIRDTDQEINFDDFSHKLKEVTGVATEGVGKSLRNEDGSPVLPSPNNNTQSNETSVEIAPDASIGPSVDAVVDIEQSVTKIDYIKVPVKRLDALLDLVEELLISRMRVQEMTQEIPELKEVFSHIDLLISGIQFEVTQSRLVPVEQAFARFPRMIRDLAQRNNKKINFEISGGEIELDRSVVDKLGEPLVHLLRNAIDHGTDTKGSIKLQALRQSERVLFVVENEGKGIDIAKVKEVALKKGLADNKTLVAMDESQVIDFIFHPNFSTKDVVTEISGRGVGLSVVKKFAESFNGRIIVENRKNGAKFTLELPQTLAIIEALLVKVKDSVFAIPFTDIVRSLKLNKKDIKQMADRYMGVIDNTNVPLIDLGGSFGIDDENYDTDSHLVVLTKKEEGMVGIIVDSLLSEQEVIVKPFTSMLQNIKEFSGSTILGNGRVVLILDILNIIKLLNKTNK